MPVFQTNNPSAAGAWDGIGGGNNDDQSGRCDVENAKLNNSLQYQRWECS
jgi:hypothetical protein